MRRYGNRPGLVMAVVLLVSVGVLWLLYRTPAEHAVLTVLAVPLVGLVVWHWRSYRDEVRLLLAWHRARRQN